MKNFLQKKNYKLLQNLVFFFVWSSIVVSDTIHNEVWMAGEKSRFEHDSKNSKLLLLELYNNTYLGHLVTLFIWGKESSKISKNSTASGRRSSKN